MGDVWYFADGGKIVGPVSYEILEARIRGALDKPQLVWTQGMESWAEARTVQAFADLFASAPPALPSQQIAGSYTSKPITPPPPLTSFEPHPWRRYFARMVDILVFGFLLGLVLLAVPGSSTGTANTTFGIPDRLFDWLALIIYIPIEALLLVMFGTTLGKYIYKIKILPQPHFTFSNAFRRSLLVWWRGLGTGFPLVSLFTLSTAHSALKQKRITSWDRDCNCQVGHDPISTARWIVTSAIWILLISLMIIGIVASLPN